jgi:hypothetical protein
MARLEDIVVGAKLHEIDPAGPVEIVTATWYGREALSVIYRDGHGTPQERVLYRLTSRDSSCSGWTLRRRGLAPSSRQRLPGRARLHDPMIVAGMPHGRTPPEFARAIHFGWSLWRSTPLAT